MIFIFFLIIVSFAAFAWGDEFRLVPSFALKEDYNTNILFVTGGRQSDFITTISPGVDVVDRNERYSADLLLRLDRLEYVKNGSLSSTNQTYNGNFQYSFSPLVSVTAGGGYTRNSNPTLNIASTGFVSASAPVDRVSSSLSGDYKFTEKMEGVVSYNYSSDSYHNSVFQDDISHTITAGLVYDFGQYFPTLKGRTNVSYNYLAFPGSRTDSVIGTVGFSRDFSEIWSVSADSGIRYTWSKVPQQLFVPVYQVINGQLFLVFVPETVQIKKASPGWVGNLSLHYKTEHGGGDLSFTRGVIPAYGLNGVSEQNALAVSSQYRLTYEFSTLFSAGYYTLSSLPGNLSSQVTRQHTYRLNPGARYDFSRDVALQSSYEYSRVYYPDTKRSANRHLVSVVFSIQHAFFE